MRPKSVSSNIIVDEFSYPLVRRYPFGRAFKWWILAAFACFMGFLTVFNLAVNGFDRNIVYTMDPNTTMSTRHWYNNEFFTWGSNSLDPTCQSLQIPVGYRFITTNLGLLYTVSRIYRVEHRSELRASASYMANTLENCDVTRIRINLKKSDNAAPDKDLRIFHRNRWSDSSATAYAECDYANNEGMFRIEFTAEYVPNKDDLSPFLTANNRTSRPIYWWGARLLNAYFAGIEHVMCGYLPDNATVPPILHALIYVFLKSEGHEEQENFEHEDSTWVYNNNTFSLSRPFTEAFMWSKIWRSFVLADLGNTEAENVLTNETLMQSLLNPTDNFNRKPGGPLDPDIKGPNKWRLSALPMDSRKNGVRVPMRDAFEMLKNDSGTMKAEKATIFGEYICNVPGQKSPVAMALYTLAANLAVFHTVWSLFKFLADRRALTKDTYSNWCVGCIEMHGNDSSEISEVDDDSQVRPNSEMVERRQSFIHDRLSSRNSSLEERRSAAGNDAYEALLTSRNPGPNFNATHGPVPP